jgi:hypothetical protein
MNEEAQRLANHAFGAPLLHVMGYMYDRKAEPWLGNIVGEWFARKYHNAATLVSASEGCIRCCQLHSDAKMTSEAHAACDSALMMFGGLCSSGTCCCIAMCASCVCP